ncbi:MAG: CotH kinase family protein, partial [Saprospiraceae bacterium]
LPYESYKRFVLRNGGQDWCVLQFRDEFATSLVGDLSDLGGIITPPHLFLQAWRPAVVYLNGQYWGIHNVRERMTRFYLRQHFGWEDAEVDLVENFSHALTGDTIAWFQFIDFLQQTDFSNPDGLDLLKQRIDYHNFLDYCAYNIYLENEDWPGNNVRRFRQRNAEGRWQWMTYDLDFTFGLYQNPGGWNTGDASPDALARLLDSTSINWPNPDWATLPFRRCWQSADFRRDFANRLADMLNTNLLPSRVSRRLDQFQSLYGPEIGAHYQRWWGAYVPEIWLDNIAKTRTFAQERPNYVREEILGAVPEARGMVELTVDAASRKGGKLTISTVHLDSLHFPWTGTYFRSLAIPVRAVARPGYHFAGWSDPGLGSLDSINLVLDTSYHLVALFEADMPPVDTIKTSSTLEINLLPNPVSGMLQVVNPELARQDFQLQIVDALGRILVDQPYPPQPNGTLLLPMRNLPNGIYFIRVTLAGSGRSGSQSFARTGG